MLSEEIRYFEANFDQLAKQYTGKVVLIKDQRVIDSFDDENEACNAGVRNFGRDEFLARRVAQQQPEVSLPALSLGLIHANS